MGVQYRRIEPEEYPLLAVALGDTPASVISLHLLLRGLARAYVAGHLAQFDGAIIQALDDPDEPVAFGADAHALWELLQRMQGWSCVNVPADIEIAKAHQVTGVDISQTQIHLARHNVPTGTFLQDDAGAVAFPAAAFDAVVSFYTLEHLPRVEHATILRRIWEWLRPGGLLLISIEASEYDDVLGAWLGVPMFLSCFDPETTKQLVAAAGFELLETAIETQVEHSTVIPYLWVLARKP